MVQDLWRDEDEEKEDEKPVRVKEETVPVKVEVPDTDVQSLNLDPPRAEWLSAADVGGGGSQMSYETKVKEEPTQSPCGFIPRYSGSESRRPDRPGFGWSWSQYQDTEVAKEPRVSVDKVRSRVVSESPTNKKVTYRSPYETGGGGTGPGSARPPNTSPFNQGFSGVVGRPSLPGTGPSTGNSSGPFGASLPGLSPIALSNVVAHVVKSLPQFFSDSATVEKARLFWNAFEANTEGLPDQSRLLVFSQKLKGPETERWWGNSSVRDFKTFKLRFHKPFLSRTADELWERLQTTKEERELCDPLNYPYVRMCYQLFRRGLRNKRCLATLNSSPACDISEATEWLMFKDVHRPIEEEDEFLGDAKTLNALASNLAGLDALSLKVDAILNAESQRQTHNYYYQPRSPRNRSPRINAVMGSNAPSGNGFVGDNGPPFKGIRLGVDQRTHDGVSVWGRCHLLGRSRETCRRQRMNVGGAEYRVISLLNVNSLMAKGFVVDRVVIFVMNKGMEFRVAPRSRDFVNWRIRPKLGNSEGGWRKRVYPSSMPKNDSVASRLMAETTKPFKAELNGETTVACVDVRMDDSLNTEEDDVENEKKEKMAATDPGKSSLLAQKNVDCNLNRDLPAYSVPNKLECAGSAQANPMLDPDHERRAPSTDGAPKYARLFSDAELDAMETCNPGQEASVLSVSRVEAEKEEYSKELEDRLYPLDEVELLIRRARNAESQREPSLSKVTSLLNLPLETLERTQKVASGGRDSPTFWMEWFQEAIAHSEEARRANRDFCRSSEDVVAPVVASSYERNMKEKRVTKKRSIEPRPLSVGKVTSESSVLENIGISFDLGKTVAMISEEIKEVDYFGKVRRGFIRTVARKAVYRMLREAMTMADQRSRTAVDSGSDDPSSRLPQREDVPGIDWEQLRWFADQIYYSQNVIRIWRSLCSRTGTRKTRAAQRRKRRARKKAMCFDCSSLYGQQVETLAGGEFRSLCDDDISHYVKVISTSESIPGFDPKHPRVEAEEDRSLKEGWLELAETAFQSFSDVRDVRRVVCSVGHFEACSSGYIDCLPSLVDSAGLKRLGKMLVSLQPYEGRVSSSSGHALLVKGWTHLPIRLGSLELSFEVLVVDQLHIDAILGVDALGAFGAVIDVANRSMVLQRSGETLPLGVETVENTYLTKVLSSMRLPPRGQALVRADLVGEVSEGSIMLVEAVFGLPPALGVDRSLCTLENGQAIVEVSNASTEEY
ncbi:LOW QUALITY PROTEIN: hypothetical protein PHMEG_0009019 [Phytophthora megakarya]|uniref:Uncharacterized protein n=1 Tax=Phytophthora megakarya TaxID=4795 RepID=A0A225WH91_9STRA|nr:LOW QUALITY PROTEIN: hypothetical protein PHMEG_0009019 [Phytophthora megakarya]